MLRAIALFAAASVVVSAAPVPGKRVNFQRDVRPLLSDNCFYCHGPDKNTRMAGLRLDTREAAFAARPGGTPIVAGKAGESLIYRRIVADKPAQLMPPPYSHKKLTAEQRETIRRWIEEGADWKEHWSFSAPVKHEPPVVKTEAWVRNPIDRFVLARLEAAGLTPAPEADRRTLIRRASLDLTGLPPTSAEVEAFVKDKRSDAYEKLVDRLMSTERWGEHRGRYWLDAARYADTHGLHIDNYREIWPYRDWVIRAFNANMPFDRFTLEQIAGDLLPNRTLDQQIASGFHRCNITTNEGGAIPDEVDAIYQKDRVETTSTVFLGLTLGCAVCHDHKFDPLLQREFYQMVAFFKNTVQKPMDGNISDTPPVIVVPALQEREKWFGLLDKEKQLMDSKSARKQAARAEFEKWLADGGKFGEPVERTAETFVLKPESTPLTKGVTLGEGMVGSGTWLRFGEKAGLEVAGAPAFNADQPFTISAWIYLPKGEDNFTVASRIQPKKQDHGWVFEIQARIPMLRFTGVDAKDDESKRDRLLIRGGNVERLEPGKWHHIAASYDGSREQAGMSLFVNGRQVLNEGQGESSPKLEGDFNTNEPLRLGWNGNKSFFNGGAIEDLRIFNRALLPDEVDAVAGWTRAEAGDRSKLFDIYLTRKDTAYREAMAAQAASVGERREIRRRGGITHVMQERTDAKPMARVLFRGMYDQPRDQVEPGVPGVLPPMTAEMPRNRLGLAKWLIDPANPLMARVTVNRFWQEMFGTGIVKTSEDFGTQGQPPVNPELLDWLAVTFREQGWDVKKMYRMMVTSATYRQAAVTTPEKHEKDPENRLLSRGPRFRMDAEMVRDYALAASGLLNDKVGGPSVKPYQPAKVWETVAMLGSNTRFYKEDSGDKLYRRSLYTFWKRSAPPASMEIFNAPSRENCTVRRERTNTPLQALVTLNDPQFVEASRRLAERALERGGGFDKRLDFITESALARTFDAKERKIARAAHDDLLLHYKSESAEAKKLLGVGASPADAKLPAAELAAWTMVASEILNLDESLNK